MTTTKKPPFTAKAHTRENYHYSEFHKALLHENSAENYALKHLYSVRNCEYILTNLDWSIEEIKESIPHITIDVRPYSIYIHIPGEIEIKNKQGISKKSIKGISQFVSKKGFIQTLIKRTWAKADPLKLEISKLFNEFVVMGSDGDFYELTLYENGITCTCPAYRGLSKAFNQDSYAYQILDEIMRGEKAVTPVAQIPDKHIFAIWKYLNVATLAEYQQAYFNRKEKFIEQNPEYLDEEDGDILTF
jgi:hypothetical protein